MKILLSIIGATALSIAIAQSQTSSTETTTTATTTTTTTESVGTISAYTPGSTLVLSTGTGEPGHYKFGKNVTYINAKGKVINASRLKKDKKVRVHYVKQGDDMVIDKVTIVKD
jgi:hypothetical protein